MRRTASLRFSAAATVVLLSVTGCSRTATVSTVRGVDIDGPLVRGTTKSVVVATDHGEVRIPRSEIEEVDHPGNGVGITGVALTAFGLLLFSGTRNDYYADGSRDREGAFWAATPALIGIPMAIAGLMTWANSRSVLDEAYLDEKDPAPLLASGVDFSDRDELRPAYAPPPPGPPDATVAAEQASQDPPGAAPGTVAATEGFQTTKWGMSQADVRALYPEVTQTAPGALSAVRPFAGFPSTIHFIYVDEKLARVRVALDRSDAADPFARLTELLTQKYQAPKTSGPVSATWNAPALEIVLRNDQGNVSVTYSPAAQPTVLDDL